MTHTEAGPAVTRQVDGAELPAAGTWQLDPGHTELAFIGRHFMLTKVRGRFTGVTGVIEVADEPGDTTVDVTIDMTTVESGNQARDEHLRSADFFDVENHAHAVLTVTSATPAGPAELRCEGTFEAAGHSRPVTFAAQLRDVTAQSVVIDAELEVDRTEFGMTWSPMRITPNTAYGTVTARFTRA